MATMHGGFADLVHDVRPAVVNVEVTRAIRPAAQSRMKWRRQWQRPGMELPEFFRHFWSTPEFAIPGTPRSEGVGSGFIVDASGLIVTSHHVVKGADAVTVTLQDGRKLEAEVVGVDPKTDLALIEVDAGESLPVVEFGDSDRTRVGDWVVAVGNPFGLGGTVTAGIVSGRGRDIGSGPYDDFLQIDAPINRGNSGGPLFDRSGRVVGVNTAIFSPTGGNVGIGFAIPANVAKPVIESLRTDGKVDRGWLGIQIQHIDETMAEALGLEDAKGALVASVMADGPAAQAGLEPGDVIVSLAGRKLDTMKDLPRIVAEIDSGTEVEITVWRDGGRKTLTATIGMQGQDTVLAAASAESDDVRLGVMLAPRGEPGKAGVTIAEVAPGSPAARNGLRPGDIIMRAGSATVNGPDDVAGAVRSAASEDKPVLLLVERGDHRRYVAIDLDRG
jgi:serine protease Do